MISSSTAQLLYSIAILVIVAVLFAILTKRAEVANSYLQKKPLSDPEQTLYWRLREALPECVVLSQVAFSRFMLPRHEMPVARRALFNRISQKSVDFLVCLPDFTVVSALELDDRTHVAAKDARRDALLKSAGIPILRVHVGEIPSVEELRAMFTK